MFDTHLSTDPALLRVPVAGLRLGLVKVDQDWLESGLVRVTVAGHLFPDPVLMSACASSAPCSLFRSLSQSTDLKPLSSQQQPKRTLL